MTPPATASTPARRSAAPATQPLRLRPDARGDRPALRVVPPPAQGLHLLLAASVLVVFVILLATASLHTVLVAGQRDLDTVNTGIKTETRRNEALQLKVAELESPERIVEAAQADGMIDPDTVTWLSPRPGGRTEQSITERPDAPDGATDPQGEGGTDVRAGSSGSGTAETEDDAAASGDQSDGGSGDGGHEDDGSGA